MNAPDHDKLAALIRMDAPEELWDVYDSAGNKTGRTQRRGDPLAPGDCHLCVHVWVRDGSGKYLLTKRAPGKSMEGLWECTGGSALMGEDSLTAALREVREETGLRLDARRGELLFRFSGAHFHCDVWRFTQDVAPDAITLQPGETCDWILADKETIHRMNEAGKLFAFEDVEYILTDTDSFT